MMEITLHIIEQFDWKSIQDAIYVFVAFYWFVLNATLEYIISRFTLGRMKHALFWRMYHQEKG